MPSFLLLLLLSSAFFLCIGSPVLAGRNVRGVGCSPSDTACKKEVGSLKKELLKELDSVDKDSTELPVTEENNVDKTYRDFLRVDKKKQDSVETKKSVSEEVKSTVSTNKIEDIITTSAPNPTTNFEEVIGEPPKESDSDDKGTLIDDSEQDDGIAKEENENAVSQPNVQFSNDGNVENAVDSETLNDENNNTQGMVAPQPQPMKAESKKNNVKGKDFEKNATELNDIYFLVVVVGCSVAGVAGLMLAGYCWYKLHNTQKQINESEYKSASSKRKSPTSMNKAPGDEKLDYNAEMYHYQHTKNQISAMEKAKAKTMKGESLEDEDEDDDVGDEGEDDTVYECPGLAPAGDMTVMNPLFSDPEAHASDDTISAQSSPQAPRSQPKH